MSLLSLVAMIVSTALPNTRLVALFPNLEFPAKGTELVKEYHDIDPHIPFTEMIASWNIQPADSAAIKLEIKARGADFESRWYTMAQWSLDPALSPRQSMKGQRDAHGNVDTDTLMLGKPGRSIDVRVTLRTLKEGPPPQLKLLTFSFENGETYTQETPNQHQAWGKTIDVPERAQNNYPNGGVLCSATSVSMMLWHYSQQLHRPEMNKDVPEVEANVWDPVYKGAGNWPFNTAYAGSFSGMRSYVARLGGISDLEKWIAAGLPVITSVSFDLLRGLPLSPTESGHLVVLVGFTDSGDPVINDPAFKAKVRKVYKRADFDKAWAYSKRTVYMLYPEDAKVPEDTNHLWIQAPK